MSVSIVHREGVHLWSVSFTKTRTPQVHGWVLMGWPISVSEFEGSLQDTDGVVVCLFTPSMAVCDGYEAGVSYL
jgi:hypothetical protein